MKVTHIEEYTPISPLNCSRYCTCGNRSPRLVEQIEPRTGAKWRIECPECGRETPMYVTVGAAKIAWSEEIYD